MIHNNNTVPFTQFNTMTTQLKSKLSPSYNASAEVF
jgi:hypothetical protein